ncbi:hypothetical protein KJ951_04165, partial [Patescibacteria group bacterium]|nr:hypothetical protein [Patescibacteria group bacterium]MBU1703573.1 hypothetical protein [Patescibacteria group bacterium]MBU1954076.1 hypothetical protein [Patescibacteria group bacterium]
MINNKKMYYWIGGIAVIIVAALAIIFSQGQLFSGNLTGFSAFRPAATTTPACISYIYSDWGPCSANGTQTRTVTGSNPINCVGGALPILSQACESKGIITLESPEQNALLNYAISNQVFSWKNKGFGQSSSGGYTIDLGCD